MTARGAVVAMFSLFFIGMLAAGWLHLGSLTGLSFVVGCALAARYTKRDGLLAAVLTPPLLFMIALVITEIMTSHSDTLRHTLTSAAEGIVLTLASAAPWLFAGVIIGVIAAMRNGLPRSFRELRADLRGDGPHSQAPASPGFRSRPPASARPARPVRPGSLAPTPRPGGLARSSPVLRPRDPGGPAPRRRGA
jgi:hypothetical protein